MNRWRFIFCWLAAVMVAGALRAGDPGLTSDERRWLAQHGPLRYAPDPNFPPFEFFRSDGQLAGITPEILAEVARSLGTTLQPVRYATWPDVLAGFRRGEADLLGTLTRTPGREAFLDYTQPYLKVPNALYVNVTETWIRGFGDLAGAGRTTGVVRNSGAHTWLRENHPELNLALMTDTREGLRALSLGRVNALLEVVPVAGYVIAENGYTNVRMLPETAFSVPQYLAVAQGHDRLRNILDKGLASVPMEDRLRIFARWTGTDPVRPGGGLPRWVVRGAAGLLLIVALVIGWNASLRRQVAVRTRALRESEAQFRRLLEDLPVPAAWADEAGRVEFANRQFTVLSGYTPAEVPTLDEWFRLAIPEARDRTRFQLEWLEEMQRAHREHRSTRPFETEIRAKGGAMRTVVIVGCIAAGKHFVLFNDMSERVRIERQLRQAQKMEAIGQLAGGVAHDFNNLLTIVQCNADLLDMEEELSGEARKSVRQISDVTHRAANLTRQLLTFSRQQAVQMREIDLNEVLHGIGELITRLLGESVTLRCVTESGLPPIQADPGMIGQIVMNLAVNARDAMPQGGELTIRTGTTMRTAGEVIARNPEARPGRFVTMAVTDTGVGIPAEVLPHLFEPFFTTKDIGKGTGLGLATVYGIAQQHAGWVEVASTPGAGTTFTIFLPALDVSAKAPGGGDGLGSHTGNETILVVEDEPMVRNLAKLCLVRCGYTVLEAGSGPEALNLWPAHRAEVDLLFTDIVMPGGMTGRELAKRLVADKPGLRVVFTSGYSRALLVDDSRWIDQITYIAKPYNLALLARVVRQCLDEPADAVRSPQPDDEPS